MNNSNESHSDIDKFLDDIETDTHVKINIRAQEQQAELDEYEAEFDVFRQQVFDVLPIVFDNDVHEIRSRAVDMGYDNLGYSLTRASAAYSEITGRRDHELDRLADLIRGVDSIAEALMYGDKQTILGVIDILHDLSSDEKTELLKVSNRLINDGTDIFDLDIQMKAVIENAKNDRKYEELTDLNRKARKLLDEEFASLCSLDDPIYIDMRAFASVAFAFKFNGYDEFDKFSKRLGIPVEKTRIAIDMVKTALSTE